MFKFLCRKALLISLFQFFFLHYLNAQLSQPGLPESFSIKEKAAMVLPVKTLEIMDTARLKADDALLKDPNRYGVVQNVSIDIKNEGVKTVIQGKGTIWQYKIVSGQAYSLGVFFSKYLLPDGAKVFIYNDDHTRLLGAFTSLNNNQRNALSIAELASKNAIIEYFEPLNPSFEGQLTIGAVSQAYIDVQATITGRIGINCPQGANWQAVKHGVCRITYVDGAYSYLCSGSLINNVRLDGTPYFLTACHCVSTNSVAATLVAYFNYENSTCSSSDAQLTQTLSGATLKAASTYSDFSLLEINEAPPISYSPYFAGWDASPRSAKTGTCIHHPAGAPKCISLDYSAPVSYNGTITWDNTSTTSPNTHWEVAFDEGTTEGGSSGSPLFDDNKRIIGQLHGGDNTYSFYGKFSLSWNYNATAAQQIKTWLDPDNTGATSLDGYMLIKPQTVFSTAIPKVCVGASVKFTDQSKYYPTSWKWTIYPASYTFTNNTSSSSQNPEVIFQNGGSYTVKLVTSNSFGSDSLIYNNYIYAAKTINVVMTGVPSDSVVCGCNLYKFPLKISGAPSYTYTIERNDNITYFTSSDTLYLSLRNATSTYSSFNSQVKVTGIFGSCVASDSAKLKVLIPVNDNVSSAIRLWPGTNPVYSNRCATTETNEPHPAATDCYSNDSWCPDNSGSSILKNTIWYNFVGPMSGIITIDTHGFNDRIAVYRADSYSDILSGSSSRYTLVAANDNRSSTDSTALIKNLAVEPGRTYWLQVDGYQGKTGNCDIELVANSLEVYPNPSSGKFNVIIANAKDGRANLDIFSSQGRLIFSRQVSVTNEANKFEMDLSSFPAGVYFLQMKINGSVNKAKIVIVK
ncbi:MAG: T9SS type A sorting domain-containing protein [Bacteroidota bacterium]|nr:T9SS type A sorting domain-containing protein [Bacteroidota bacterium]